MKIDERHADLRLALVDASPPAADGKRLAFLLGLPVVPVELM